VAWGGAGNDEFIVRAQQQFDATGPDMSGNFASGFINGGPGQDTVRVVGGDHDAVRQALLANLESESIPHRLEPDGSVTILSSTSLFELRIGSPSPGVTPDNVFKVAGVERVVFS
jgi:Ca2+-binding RTX toxin-like protein